MTNNSTIIVPSPDDIASLLFPDGNRSIPSLPSTWTANVLLTPHGGVNIAGIVTDQPAAARISFDASSGTARHLRVQMFLLESRLYFDWFFTTKNRSNSWWYLESDPANLETPPSQTHGPYASSAEVPTTDFLLKGQFKHVGTWNVIGKKSHAFSGRKTAQPSTWLWLNAATSLPRRMMNIDSSNDFKLAVIGSYYFVDFTTFEADTGSLDGLYAQLPKGPPQPNSKMLTLADLFAGMSTLPPSQHTKCTLTEIQAVLPGIVQVSGTEVPPKWTDAVESQCFMIGQDDYPYYCQIYYDWNQGCQVTVFVQQDNTGKYQVRFDEFLPRGKVGPAIVYDWTDGSWKPACSQKDGGVVPMPVPNFVEVAEGACRAAFQNSDYFGNLTIWTVALGNAQTWSDFWYWFDSSQKGVIFSLAPARSLTIIDYQTFVQNPTLDSGKFYDPTNEIPVCASNSLEFALRRPAFKMPILLHH
jgi:hypothetical protein